MMKSMIAAVAGVAGLAAGANAAWGVKFEVWDNSASAWVANVQAAAGDVVKFRFGIYFDENSPPAITTADGTGVAQALNRYTGSNQVTNFGAGDAVQNLVKGSAITNVGSTWNQVTGGSSATIGTGAVTSFLSALYLGDIPNMPYIEVYHGEVKIADGTDRVMSLQIKTFGSGNTKGATFYNTAALASKQSAAPTDAATNFNATITVVPAPASLALVGLGGLVAARRRRA